MYQTVLLEQMCFKTLFGLSVETQVSVEACGTADTQHLNF